MRKRWPLLLLLLTAAVLGGLACCHGMLFFPDEYRYFLPLLAAYLVKTTGQPALVMVDRPLALFLYLPPLFLQWMADGFAFRPEPDSGWVLALSNLWIPALYQTGIFVLNAFLFSRLAGRLFGNRLLTYAATLFFILWLPNLMFTRHLLPTAAAETLLLLGLLHAVAFCRASDAATQNRQALWMGVLFSLQFFTYPGFYYTSLLFAALIIARRGRVLFRLLLFAAPLLLGLSAMALLTGTFAGQDYVAFLSGLLQSVSQGDRGDAVLFSGEYFAAFAPFFALFAGFSMLGGVIAFFRGQRSPQAVVSALAVLVMLWLGLYVTVAQSVLYGRLLLPLGLGMTILAASGWFWLLEAMPQQRLVVWGLGAGLLLSLVWPLPGFFAMRFPRDAVAALAGQTGAAPPHAYRHSRYIRDFDMQATMLSPESIALEGRTVLTEATGGRTDFICDSVTQLRPFGRDIYLLLNPVYVYPVAGVLPLNAPAVREGVVLFDAPHPVMHPVYGFEGLSRSQRRMLQQNSAPMLVVKNPCGGRQSL